MRLRSFDAPLHGLQVWDRGWLSSTQVLIAPAPGEPGAVLIDSAHALHIDQTQALLTRGLAGRPLHAVINTHLHSDHCGGNARLREAFGAEVWIPSGQALAARAWQGLSHQHTGQTLPRFAVDRVLAAGDALVAGGREWQLLAAPGHDPHALMLWDATHGVLAAGDALWEQGFGVVFPELWGEAAFDDALTVLDRIEALRVRVLVPGHGPSCHEVREALSQARHRLHGWRKDPRQHARYAAKVLIKYHLMERRREPLSDLLAWAEPLWLIQALWQHLDPKPAPTLRAWLRTLVEGLVEQGALMAEGDGVRDA